MRILHTSDWHLGRALYGRSRYEEFSQFLDWLADLLTGCGCGALLVSGDVFDTSTPSNQAQALYYNFLNKVSSCSCLDIIIIGGNHDSPNFLNAPAPLLKSMRVHVVGCMTDNPEDEILVLHDREGQPSAIICAVPYLRDRDIRVVQPGETVDDKQSKLLQGLREHYELVCGLAAAKQEQIKAEYKLDVPVIAMGHLFTAGGQSVDGDGVRDLYVGSLAQLQASAFPQTIDYLALGHLHVPQKVGGFNHMRYSGSPLPMGFGEAGQQKLVLKVDFDSSVQVSEIEVPCFRELIAVAGDLPAIRDKLEVLAGSGSEAWLEIEYTGREIVPDLREQIEAVISDSNLEIRRIRNRQVIEQVLAQESQDENLEEIDPDEVFRRCLEQNQIEESQRPQLLDAYHEILTAVLEGEL